MARSFVRTHTAWHRIMLPAIQKARSGDASGLVWDVNWRSSLRQSFV